MSSPRRYSSRAPNLIWVSRSSQYSAIKQLACIQADSRDTGTNPLLPWCSAMLRAVLPILVPAALVTPLDIQVPTVGSSHRGRDEHPTILSDGHDSGWRLGEVPHPNSTDHLLFDTVSSLLQRWPNTRMRHGRPSLTHLSDCR